MSCMAFRNRYQWLHGLRRRSAVDCLLGLWVRTPQGAWLSVSWKCRVLSGRGLCEGADPSSRWVLLSGVCVCVCVCVLIVMPRRWGDLGPSSAIAPKKAKKNGVRYELNLVYSSVTLSLQMAVSCYRIKATTIYSLYVSASARKYFTRRTQYNFIMWEDDITVTYILPLL
jgi:hypothetical protein